MATVEIFKGSKKHVTLVAVGGTAATIELNGPAASSFNVANENVQTLSVKSVAWTANSGAAYWEVRRGGSTGNLIGQFPNAGEWHLDESYCSLAANNTLNAQNVTVNLVGTGAVGTIVVGLSKDGVLTVPVP